MHKHDTTASLSQMAIDMETVLRSYRVYSLGAKGREEHDHIWADEVNLSLWASVPQCGEVHFLHGHGRVHI